MASNTEIVFILDKSGSMGGLESDTIGGFNSMLKKQQAAEAIGQIRITTVLFDNNYELLHDRLDIEAVEPITEKDYFVGGSTALLDAIGKTIHKIDGAQKSSKEEYRADKILFVITTDGMENASREYAYEKIKRLIERKKENGWEFIFLGANIDAVEVAGHMGIDANRAVRYRADSAGTGVLFDSLAGTILNFGSGSSSYKVSENWADEIKEDYENRKE